MPTIAWFYGIAIRMYYKDHPPPHFHAVYGEHEAIIAISSGEILQGRLPKAAAGLVKDWASTHRVQLQDNWRRAADAEPLERIPGLDAD